MIKVVITTIRELPEEMFWPWAMATIYTMKKGDPSSPYGPEIFQQLLDTGRIEMKRAGGFSPEDRIISVYEIIKGEGQ